MPLSDHEQRMLDQIESALYAEDPKFASSVRGGTLHAPSARRRLQGAGLFVLGLALLVLVWLLLPETHPPEHRTPLHVGPLFASLWAVWRDQHGRRLALTAMVNFAGMFLYISSAPYIVVSMLHMGEQDFWVLFVPLISGMVIGSWFSGRLAGQISGRRLATIGRRTSSARSPMILVRTTLDSRPLAGGI